MESTPTQSKSVPENSTLWGNSSTETIREELVKGAFSDHEIELLKSALCDYARHQHLCEEQLMQLVSSVGEPSESRELWTFVHARLPTRSLQSIKSFCQRRFNPRNYRGKWSREEVAQLIALVQQHGCRWQKLSQLLQRTPTNIRDKWRTIGDCNFRERNCQKVWSVEEILKLFRLIECTQGTRILLSPTDDPIVAEFVRFKERFPLLQAGRDNKHLNSFCRKVVCRFLEPDAPHFLANAKIKWNLVAKMMETKSKDDCRNYWRSQILKEFSGTGTLQKRSVLKLLHHLQRIGLKHAHDVDWTSLPIPDAARIWQHVRSVVPEGDDFEEIARRYAELCQRGKHKKYTKHQTDLSRNELLAFFREHA